MIDKSPWRQANGRSAPVVLVTGGAGYIGSQLVRDLAEDPLLAGTTLRIFDNMQSGGYQALMDLPPQGRYEFLEGDILDPATVRLALQGVSAVVHLAAIAKTPVSFDHPAWTEQVNHWGTAQLVEQCLQAGVTRFIYASSTGVYGPGGPFDEEAPCRPVGAYAQSKLRAEQAILAATTRGLRPTILRLGTVCGLAPRMRFDAVANRFAYLAGVGRPLVVYGTGQQTRPFLHVRDATDAIRFCLTSQQETVGEVLNVAGANASILDLVAILREARPEIRVHYTEQDVLNHLSFAVDSSKLERTGWRPKHTLEAGVLQVLARFRSIQPLSLHPVTTEDDN